MTSVSITERRVRSRSNFMQERRGGDLDESHLSHLPLDQGRLFFKKNRMRFCFVLRRDVLEMQSRKPRKMLDAFSLHFPPGCTCRGGKCRILRREDVGSLEKIGGREHEKPPHKLFFKPPHKHDWRIMKSGSLSTGHCKILTPLSVLLRARILRSHLPLLTSKNREPFPGLSVSP